MKKQGWLTLVLEIAIILALFIIVQIAGLKYKDFEYDDALTLLSVRDHRPVLVQLFEREPLAEVEADFFQGLIKPARGFQNPLTTLSGMHHDILLIDTYLPGLLLGLAYYLRPEQRVWCGNPKDVADKIQEKMNTDMPARILLHAFHAQARRRYHARLHSGGLVRSVSHRPSAFQRPVASLLFTKEAGKNFQT